MSTINTNSINVNYPVPGINNSSQGFRDNFASIKTNLNAAATEITDLQNVVVVKSALANTTINNDMANTLISNASVRNFRATTYNLGASISGTIVINRALGDVQYGTIAANTTIQFAGWAPSGTQSNLELQLTVANTDAVISFPTNVSMTGSYGVETLENFANVAGIPTVTVAAGVSQLDYMFSTIDCGNKIFVEPINRPRRTTQVQERTPSPIGLPGDKNGAMAVDPATSTAFATCTNTTTTYNTITCDSTTGMYLNMPVSFYGTTFGGITAGTTYYVRTIPNETTFTISATPSTSSSTTAAVTLSNASGTMYVTPISYLYISAGTYSATANSASVITTNAVATTTYATNTNTSGNITLLSTSGLANGQPITFTGTAFGGLVSGNPYYIVDVSGSNVKVGVYQDSAPITLTTASGNIAVSATTNYTVTCYTSPAFVANDPIIFTGNTFGGIVANTVYYVTGTPSANAFSISASRYNGVAGPKVVLTNDSNANHSGTTFLATSYNGEDIWKRTEFKGW